MSVWKSDEKLLISDNETDSAFFYVSNIFSKLSEI